MDRYLDNTLEKPSSSRLKRNEELYEKIYTNQIYTEFTNAKIDNAVDITSIGNSTNNNRESYQQSILINPNYDPSKDINYDVLEDNSDKVVSSDTNKSYNINDVLEEARKNRKEEDSLEKKRRIKNVEYSILSDLSMEKLKEYHDSKQNLSKEESENLEELIHTITSNSLRKKIDDELLIDLLPSDESETIVSKTLIDKTLEMASKNDKLNEELEEESKIDDSFYTKSIELTKDDLEVEKKDDDDDFSFVENKKMGILPKIIILLFILVVVFIIGYVIYYFV